MIFNFLVFNLTGITPEVYEGFGGGAESFRSQNTENFFIQ
jgi:hypothetical protein